MSRLKSCISWVNTLCKLLYYMPFYIYLFLASVLDLILNILKRQKKSLDGEIILVTGAASGIGQQVVWKLAEKFPTATFVLWDINYSGLQKTAEKCKHFGANKVKIYKVDLSMRDDVTNAASQVKHEVGNVTVLFNNAGMCKNSYFLNADLGMIEKEIRVNFFSHLYAIQNFLPGMMERGQGHIIATCSAVAFYRFAGISGYAASKYAVRGFMETLSMEMRQLPKNKNIKVSVIFPGSVSTPIWEENASFEARYDFLRDMKPEHVAEQIVDGILKEKPEICVPSWLKWFEIFYRLFPTRYVDDMEKHVCKNIKLHEHS